jgi:hypothetical protein
MATTPSFGVVSTAQGRGLIQSMAFTNTADKAEARNEGGNIIARHYYGGGRSVVISALFTSEVDLPSIGAPVHVLAAGEPMFNGTYYVDGATFGEVNTNYANITINASKAHPVDVEVTFSGSSPSPSP